MATHPSKQFDDDGVLVERALSTDVAGDPDEAEAKADRAYKETAPSTFADRAKARKKAMKSSDTEDKSVKSKASAKK